MGKARVVIVDDSSFSVALIKQMLQSFGYEVVGSAGNYEEVKDEITEKMPEFVTMDMSLPGTTGIECIKLVKSIHKDAKIIVISAMKDNEIVAESKKAGADEYIQKPIDEFEFEKAMERLSSDESLYRFLEREAIGAFEEALQIGLQKRTDVRIEFRNIAITDHELPSMGITILIGIIGRYTGRLLLDVSEQTAENVVTILLGKKPESRDEMTDAISEYCNIVAGNACSLLNRRRSSLGLRVAPPSVIYGEDISIVIPEFAEHFAYGESQFGNVLLNVGFMRGE